MPGFDELLRYEAEIFRFACRLTGNRDDASDVLQQTFLNALRAFRRLPAGANHRAWLYRIAANAASNLARRRRRQKTVPLERAARVAERNGDLEHLVETRRLGRLVGAAVRRLPRRQRVALLLRKYEGLSYAEVAEALDCSETTARAHVYQAMRKIRRALEEGR